jgi:hypothetical protein
MNSVLVLFSRSREFIPGITFKDVQQIINDYSTSIQWNHGLCKFVSKIFNLGCVLSIYTWYFIDTRTPRDLACAQMKFHKHVRDLYVLKRISNPGQCYILVQ